MNKLIELEAVLTLLLTGFEDSAFDMKFNLSPLYMYPIPAPIMAEINIISIAVIMTFLLRSMNPSSNSFIIITMSK